MKNTNIVYTSADGHTYIFDHTCVNLQDTKLKYDQDSFSLNMILVEGGLCFLSLHLKLKL